MNELPFLLLLPALLGVDEVPQIDPSRVTSLQAQSEERVALNIFMYDETDTRGWPASIEHRQFIRFLQDSDVEVAFQRDTEGRHHVLIFEEDVDRFRLMLRFAAEKRIPIPDIVPQQVQLAPPPPRRAPQPASTPMWFNVVMLIVSVALLAWAFSRHDAR